MKIAWVTTYPLEQVAPIQSELRDWKFFYHPSTWIVAGAKALSKNPDVELHLIVPAPNTSRSITYISEQIHFHILPVWRRNRSLCFFASDIWRIRRKLSELQPHIVHGHGTEDSYGLSAVLSGFPHVVSIQGLIHQISNYEPYHLRSMIVCWTEWATIRRAKHIISKSEWAERIILQIQPAANVHRIEDPVSDIFFDQKPCEPLRFIFVGSLLQRKGLFDLLQAVAELNAKGFDIHLDVVGTGNLKAAQEFAKKCAATNVIFHQYLYSQKISELLQSAIALILPSYIENTSNALMEAMAAGVPCIAYSNSGTQEVLQKSQGGILVETGNVVDLASAMLQIRHPATRQLLSENARRYAEKWRSETHAKNLFKLYQSILNS